MSNIHALRPKDLSPTIILQNALAESQEAKACYIVMIDKEGEAQVWTTGNVGHLCHASQALNTITQRYLRGEVDGD